MKKKFREFSQKVFYSSWLVGLVSLVWLLMRTGIKPSRIIYPCQQLAKSNVAVFGIPSAWLFWQRFKKCPRYRRKIGMALVALVLVLLGWWGLEKNFSRLVIGILAPKAIGQGGSRVVWITDNNATSGDYSPSGGNQSVINNMLDEAIMALTGTSSLSSAWAQILPCGSACSGKKIAVKVNFNNDSNCNSSGCPVYQVAAALARQLVNEAGIPAGNINFYDSSRSIPSYFRNGVNDVVSGLEFNQYGGQGSDYSVFGVPIGVNLVEADYLINMPLLRTHSTAGVTLSFKNHLGSITSPGSFPHGAFFSGSADSNSLIQLNRHEQIKNKTILVIDDALYGLRSGGPSGRPNITPNSLFLSRDPVAVDSVMIDYLASVGADVNRFGDARTYLRLAAGIGLGLFETSPNFNYTAIDLVRCENGNCPGTSLSPIPTSTLTPACAGQGDVNCDETVDYQDASMVLKKYGQNPSQVPGYHDPVGDNKINGLDLTYVIKDWNL